MSSNKRRVVFNTRERLLSTDMNDMTALLNSGTSDDIAAATTGDFFDTSLPLGSRQSGVLSGGIVTFIVASTSVNISPIRALKLGSGATGFDSDYLAIQTSANTVLPLASFIDGAQDRWVAIEIAPGGFTELASTRDIFNPALGTFTPVNIDKIDGSLPLITVNAGTPAATPVLPTGTAGTIPLAYVYLEAAATDINAIDIILCRPLMGANKSDLAGTADLVEITGVGGIDVTAADKPNNIACRDVMFRWGERNRVPIGITNGETTTVAIQAAGSPNYELGDATPVADAPLYVYAMAAPYPSGYDADVADNREFVDLSGRIPSNIDSQVNSIVYVSLQPPLLNALGSSPVSPTSVNDPVWNGGSSRFIGYLGAFAFHTTNGATGSGAQITEGDTVRVNAFTDTTQSPTDQDVEQNTTSTVTSSLRNMSPLEQDGSSQGLFIIQPIAFVWDILVEATNSGPASSFTQRISSSTAAGPSEPVVLGSLNVGWWQLYTSQTYLIQQLRVRTNSTGDIDWFHQNGDAGNSTTLRLTVLGYRDAILEKR